MEKSKIVEFIQPKEERAAERKPKTRGWQPLFADDEDIQQKIKMGKKFLIVSNEHPRVVMASKIQYVESEGLPCISVQRLKNHYKGKTTSISRQIPETHIIPLSNLRKERCQFRT